MAQALVACLRERLTILECVQNNAYGSLLSGNELSTAVYQTFSMSLPFTAGTTASYTIGDTTRVDFTGGVVRLTPASQTDDSTVTGASSGGYVRLNTTTNNAELDSSWTPQWSSLVGYWPLNGAGAISNGTSISATVGTAGVSSNSNGTGMVYIGVPRG